MQVCIFYSKYQYLNRLTILIKFIVQISILKDPILIIKFLLKYCACNFKGMYILIYECFTVSIIMFR